MRCGRAGRIDTYHETSNISRIKKIIAYTLAFFKWLG